MDETKGNHCRFCLKTIHDDMFDKIGEVTRQMLNALLKLNLDKDTDLVMCLECETKLQSAVDFKTTCLKSKLPPCVNFENNVKLMSEEENSKKNTVTLELHDISSHRRQCQFCMSLTDSNSCTRLRDRKETVFSIDLVQKHIPELGLNAKELEICESCLFALENLSSFIMVCCHAEERIRETESKANKEQFNLNDISVKSERVADIEDNDNNSVEHITVKNEVGYDNSKEIGNMNVNLKSEDIEIKSEQDDYERFCDTKPIMHLMEHTRPTCQNADITSTTDSPLEINTYKCNMCPYKTSTKRHLHRHGLIHQDPSEVKMYQCEKCPFTSKHSSSLGRHNMWIHDKITSKITELTIHKCTVCSYETRKKGNLERHMLIHKDPFELKMYDCGKCAFATKRKDTLKYHMLIHQQRMPHNCDQCQFETKNKRQLDQHMLIHQNNLEVYKCKLCYFETKYKSNIGIHMLIHQDISKVKMYNCEICSFSTKVKDVLKQHLLIHKNMSEVTVYTCEVCSHKTKRKGCLKRHMLTHQNPSEIEMFRCDSCLFATKYVQSLKQHMLTHQDNQEK